jgi:hypothetical protein
MKEEEREPYDPFDGDDGEADNPENEPKIWVTAIFLTNP